MGNYKEGGWRDKYVIFKRVVCPDCNGEGSGPCTCPVRSPGQCFSVHICGGCDGRGWFPKVTDPDAVYFVLRLDEDPHARIAAIAYAQSVQRENPQLAIDIREKLAATRKAEFEV